MGRAARLTSAMDNLMSFSEGADPSKQRKSKSNRWSGASNSDGSSDKAAPAAAGASAISDIAAGLKRFELEQSRLKKAAPLPAAKKAAAPAAPAPAAAAPAPANAKAGSPDDADWVCTGCAARGEDGTVPKGFKFCPICGDSFHGTPNPKAKPPAVAEEWQCEGCGEVSIAGWYYCFECGRPHGAPKPPPPGECGGCGEYVPEGDLWKFCWNCGTATGEWDSGAKGRAARFETNEELGDWTCHGCREEVAGTRYCPCCGAQKPG